MTFFFHYNKPASIAAGRNKLSVHWKKTCLIVDGVKCFVPIHSVDRKKQPCCVMRGIAQDISIRDGNIAYIS